KSLPRTAPPRVSGKSRSVSIGSSSSSRSAGTELGPIRNPIASAASQDHGLLIASPSSRGCAGALDTPAWAAVPGFDAAQSGSERPAQLHEHLVALADAREA